MRLRFTSASASALLAIAAASAAWAQKVPPAKAFGALESVVDPDLSPDGTKFSFLAPAGQGNGLFVAPVDGSSAPVRIMVSSGDPEYINWCGWVGKARLVCQVGVVAKVAGFVGGGSRLVALDDDGKNFRQLSERKSERALYGTLFGGQIVDWLADEEDALLMLQWNVAQNTTGSLIQKSREGFSLERVDTRTLSRRHVTQPSIEIYKYLTDGLGHIRVMGVTRYTGDYVRTGEYLFKYRTPDSKDWIDLGSWDSNKREGFYPIAVDPTLNVAYGLQKHEGRMALFSRKLDGNTKEELVFVHPRVDVGGLIRIGRKKRIIAISYQTERYGAKFLDPDMEKLSDALEKALPGDVDIAYTGTSDDESKLLLRADGDTDPGTLYFLDRATKQMRPLLLVRPELQDYTLAEMKPVRVKARDGAMIPAYLTVPPGSTGKNLPAIVMPHGGPSYRDAWGFDWLVQYFVHRGFAVLQPNFRGSTGYGDDWYLENGFLSWRTAIADVVDSGRWLVSEGIADPTKLAIFGWSYGGYAALQSGVVEPDLFKAIVAVAPVTDLDELKRQYARTSAQREARLFIGSGPEAAAGSPARHAAAFRAPVQIFHGEVDLNVEVAQGRMMADALRDAGKRVEFHLYPKLEHSLVNAAAREDMLTKSDAFLRATLGIK